MLDDVVVVARPSEVLWRDAPGYLVVATIDDVALEASGPAPGIWRAIDDPIKIGGLNASLAVAHALAPEQASGDVMAFLCGLLVAGLVTIDG